MSQISVKWSHNGAFRRFGLPIPASGDLYGAMMAKILAVVPDFNESLAWKDSEDDLIVFCSTTELNEAVNAIKADEPLRIFTVTAKPSESKKMTSEEKGVKSDQTTKETVHPTVVCDGCDGKVTGIRYKCLGCPDFDLCSDCEKKALHTHHPMARITDPADRSWVPHHLMFMRRMWKQRENGGGGPCGRRAYFRPMNEQMWEQMQKKHQQKKNANEEQKKEGEAGKEQSSPADPFLNGMDFLREVGVTVAEAISNFGINVDIDVEHGGKKEKVNGECKKENDEAKKDDDEVKKDEVKQQESGEKEKDVQKSDQAVAGDKQEEKSGDEANTCLEWTLVDGEMKAKENNIYPQVAPQQAEPAPPIHHGKIKTEFSPVKQKSSSRIQLSESEEFHDSNETLNTQISNFDLKTAVKFARSLLNRKSNLGKAPLEYRFKYFVSQMMIKAKPRHMSLEDMNSKLTARYSRLTRKDGKIDKFPQTKLSLAETLDLQSWPADVMLKAALKEFEGKLPTDQTELANLINATIVNAKININSNIKIEARRKEK